MQFNTNKNIQRPNCIPWSELSLLNLKAPIITAADDILIFLLFFIENKTRHFRWIVCITWNKAYFLWKNKNKNKCCLLQLWFFFLMVNIRHRAFILKTGCYSWNCKTGNIGKAKTGCYKEVAYVQRFKRQQKLELVFVKHYAPNCLILTLLDSNTACPWR